MACIDINAHKSMNTSHETHEVQDQIHESIRPILWFMLEELDNPTPNHHFELTVTEIDGEAKQKIVHTQKTTTYHREFSFRCATPITESVYIIGFGKNDWLMMLQPQSMFGSV